jgi:hypothetical protein
VIDLLGISFLALCLCFCILRGLLLLKVILAMVSFNLYIRVFDPMSYFFFSFLNELSGSINFSFYLLPEVVNVLDSHWLLFLFFWF